MANELGTVLKFWPDEIRHFGCFIIRI